MSKKEITCNTAPSAIGTYSPAITAGNLVFISGQIPLNYKDMTVIEGSFEEQVETVINNIKNIASDAECTLNDCVKFTVYLKDIEKPKYAIWAMMKNKEPDLFIKQFKGIFKKIITTPIENEKNCMSAKHLKAIAQKNHFNVDAAKNLDDEIKKISSRDKKLIICLGSLYNVGNILNKN